MRLRDASDQFCDWLHDLGGDTNIDVDPAVVRNLFSTAYDTKPSLSVPIKIVETTRVRPGSRMSTHRTDRSFRLGSFGTARGRTGDNDPGTGTRANNAAQLGKFTAESIRIVSRLSLQAALPDGSKSKENPSTGAASDRAARAQKYRYGAWYLPKDLWQRSPITDELQDPKLIKAQREDATRKREEQIVI